MIEQGADVIHQIGVTIAAEVGAIAAADGQIVDDAAESVGQPGRQEQERAGIVGESGMNTSDGPAPQEK